MDTQFAISVSTRNGLLGSEALANWSDFISRTMSRTVVGVNAPAHFYAEGEVVRFSGLTACHLKNAANEVVCDAGTAQPSHLADDSWQVCLQLRGTSHVVQGDKKLQLVPGEWSLNYRSLPYQVSNREEVEQLVLIIPRRELPTDVLALAPHATGSYATTAGAARIFAQLLTLSFPELCRLEGNATHAMSDTLLGLLRAAMLERFSQTTRPTDMLLERIRAHVTRNIHDPELCVEQIAAALRCSKRYIHRAFQETGTTPSQTIQDLRLDRCRADLTDPMLQNRSIASIAYAWGFKDPGHFGRAFRRKYSMTPREYRLQF